MHVKDVMTGEVRAVRADMPLAVIIDLLERRDDGILAIFDGTQFIGTVTEHEIVAWCATPGHVIEDTKARDVVHPEVAVSREDQEVEEVARLMREQRVPGLVVLRDGQPVGAVTLADLAAKLDGAGETQPDTVAWG